jgi:hypothetical protein
MVHAHQLCQKEYGDFPSSWITGMVLAFEDGIYSKYIYNDPCGDTLNYKPQL